ncbi:conserved hypothetical protein, partial [Ricinus communis]
AALCNVVAYQDALAVRLDRPNFKHVVFLSRAAGSLHGLAPDDQDLASAKSCDDAMIAHNPRKVTTGSFNTTERIPMEP